MNQKQLMGLKKAELVGMILEGFQPATAGTVMELKVEWFEEAVPVKEKNGNNSETRFKVGKARLVTQVRGKEVPAFVGIVIFFNAKKGTHALGLKFLRMTEGFQNLVLAGIAKQKKEGRVEIVKS